MKSAFGKTVYLLTVMGLGIFLLAGCGSKGGKSTPGGDDGDGGDTPAPQPTFNFTGTVFSRTGNSVPQVDVRAIQSEEGVDTTVTDAAGQFSMNVAEEMNTVVGTRAGFVPVFRLADLSSGEAVEQTLLMQTAVASSVSINAQSGGSVISNAIDGQRARLNIASQPDGAFDVFDDNSRSSASSTPISLEYIDLSKPLPVPLPSPDTLSGDDVIMGGKQTPSVLVSIDPPLLRMANPSELVLPNPDGLSGVRILHFDPYEHRWTVVREVVRETDATPGDGTSVSVSEGGVYGIFYEENRTGTVRGTATPGSYVYVGDDVIKVLADGTFYAGEVPIPPNGQLEVFAVGPDGEVLQRVVNIGPDDVVTIALAAVEIASVNVTADAEEIIADGEATATVTATVLDVNQEAAIDGTEVVFSTTSGTLSCPSASTAGCVETLGGVKAQTANGIARVVLTSSMAIGTATVTASADDVSDNVAIDFVAGAPYRVEMSANPNNLTANGSQTSTINAVVFDAADRRLSGVSILFELDPVNMGQLSETVVTTSQTGLASVEFTAPTNLDQDTVTVIARDEDGNELEGGQVSITLIEAQVASITAETGADSIVADGETMVLVAATVNDPDGNAVSDGTEVTFTTSAGTFEGATDPAAQINRATTGGRATASLISATNVGTATITVTAGGVWNTVTVDFTPGPAATLTAQANPSKLTIGEGTTSTITMTVRDGFENFVPGETLTIQDSGIFGSLDSRTAQTDASGSATVSYTPPSLVPQEGKDEIPIVTTNGLEATVEIQLVGPQIASILLAAEPTTLPADGESQAIVSATLTLIGGDPAPDNTPVYFGVVSGGGSFANDIEQSLTVDGEAIARLTSGDDPGTATIQVGTDKFVEVDDQGVQTERIGGIVQEIEIEYTPGSIGILIVPDVVLGTGQDSCDGTALNCAEIVATLENDNGDPAVGEKVTFTLTGSPGMSQTGTVRVQEDFQCENDLNDNVGCGDEAGAVKAFFLAPNEGGEVTVTATWETEGVEVTGTGTITVNPPPVVINVVSPDPTEISVRGTGGQETVQLFFEVKDSAGNPVVDGYRIDFVIVTGPGGEESVTPIFDLTQDGRVGTVLRSGFQSGPVSIKATYFNDSNISTVVSQIVIKGGRPVGKGFSVESQYNNISGLAILGLENQIKATVSDYYGNAVPDNTIIHFATFGTGGIIEGTEGQSSNTVGGFAFSTLFSANSPQPLQGGVSVTAMADGGRTTHITSIDLVPFDFDVRDRFIVFAGTNGGGVYKSLDSGKTWDNISRSEKPEFSGQNWISPYVNDVAIDRDETNIVYAATGVSGDGNIYRSNSGGLNWDSGTAEEWFGLKSYPAGELRTKLNGAVLTILCDYDDAIRPSKEYPYVWAGSAENGVFFSADGVIFSQAEGVGKGSEINNYAINDIVRVSGTHYDEDELGNVIEEAVLYAATQSGVYKSMDSGRTWHYNTNDPADGVPDELAQYVNTLVLHPSSDGGVSDKLYAGTEEAGVFVSTNSGKSWESYEEGLGEGIKATTPVANVWNKGNGRVTDVAVGKKTKSENWVIEYDAINGEFEISGSDSGGQVAEVDGDRYVVDSVDLSFTITDGSIPFETGDKFTFRTIRDPGKNIKDLLLDLSNNRLYAITYFNPEGSHAVGNLYYYELDESGFMKEGALWIEASAGLPEFDPPDDPTLFAQHALALSQEIDIPTDGLKTKRLYVGGEGINFYSAPPEPTLNWTESKTGIDNKIMARTFTLFSDYAYMSFELVAIRNKDGQEIPINNLPVTIEDGDELIFEAYVQDRFGNPPIVGSVFSVETNQQRNVFRIEYPDTLIYAGTWRDPTDERTDNPFRISYIYADTDGGLVFEFEPACTETAPGCSGSTQRITIQLPIIRDTFWSF